MRVLFLDCFSGISGDMTVGALCDLGVKPSTFEWELSKLDIGDFHLHFERKKRQQIEGVKFSVHAGATHTHDQDEEPDEHGQVHAQAHAHEHEHHGHSHGEESEAHSHETEHEHEHEHHHHDEANLPDHEHGPAHVHVHEHDEDNKHETHAHAPGDECGCGHEHDHDHDHEHDHHKHAHSHSHDHGHEHKPTHAHGRSYVEIRALIERSDLSDFVKKHALSIFHRVAIAEAKVHGASVESIGFHEVGALDSITDIVLACVGIEELGVEKIFIGPLTDGRGWIDCAHGRFPIPVPATLEILKGIAPIAQIDEPYEFITPTGAAIAAEFAESFGPMPSLKIEKIGYGIGTRQHPTRPNALRAMLGDLDFAEQKMFHGEQSAAVAAPGSAASQVHGYEIDTVTQIETNIDDLSPELTGAVLDQLLVAGALDAFFTPAQMKKNRPGVLLTVLCAPDAVGRIADLIFRETSSFGVRLSQKERLKLERRIESVETPHGSINVKLGFKAGQLLQAAPEYESCRAAAERTGKPVREVYLVAAQAASQQHGGSPA